MVRSRRGAEVAHLLWEQVVVSSNLTASTHSWGSEWNWYTSPTQNRWFAGSNPASPTQLKNNRGTFVARTSDVNVNWSPFVDSVLKKIAEPMTASEALANLERLLEELNDVANALRDDIRSAEEEESQA